MNPKGFLILFMSVTKKPMRVSPPLRLLGEGNEEEFFFLVQVFFIGSTTRAPSTVMFVHGVVGVICCFCIYI
jgi:hypothetical protein